MKELYLMRHGQTLFNVRHKIQGWCDSPLTDIGIEQAKRAREALKFGSFDHYYCSTSERSSDTLEIVAKGASYQRLKGLKERGFGAFEGEIEELHPHRYGSLSFDDIYPYYGGETTQEVRERMVSSLRTIMEKEDHHVVLAVSHAGACTAFLSHVIEPKKVLKNGLPNCSVLHFVYESGIFRFLEVIDTQR